MMFPLTLVSLFLAVFPAISMALEECKYEVEDGLVKYSLDKVDCAIYQTLNYKARPYVQFYFNGKNSDGKDPHTSFTVSTDYGPCFNVSVIPGQITVKSLVSNTDVSFGVSTVQIRQWDGNGLYVNSKRVGAACPLTISHGGDRMDVAFMRITSEPKAGSLSFTFPHRPTTLNVNDTSRMHRILDGGDNGIDKPSKRYNWHPICFMVMAVLVGIVIGLIGVSVFVRLAWWKDLTGKPKAKPTKNPKAKPAAKDKSSKEQSSRNKSSKAKSSKKSDRSDKKKKSKKGKSAKSDKETNPQTAPTEKTPKQSDSATSPNKQYENL